MEDSPWSGYPGLQVYVTDVPKWNSSSSLPVCFPLGMSGGGSQGIPAEVQNKASKFNRSTKSLEIPQSVGHKHLS